MLLENLGAIRHHYTHVYLSPHLDDAALSCGGTIARQRAAGDLVLVVTICTAAPPVEGPFSPLAQEFHREWGLTPGDVVAARRREDAAAMAALGADSVLLNELDAIYRAPSSYHRRETLFGTPVQDDPLLPVLHTRFAALRERVPAARFYAPLGVGGHIDHLITHQVAAACLPAVVFYEDFPYVARNGALEYRLGQMNTLLREKSVEIAATLDRKLQAICAYTSQLDELAHSQLDRQVRGVAAVAVMQAAVRDYAQHVGGERFWMVE